MCDEGGKTELGQSLRAGPREAGGAGRRRLLSWGATDAGAVRSVNQDSYLTRDELGLWMVADGAGGHDGGTLASQTIVRELAELSAGLSDESVVDEVANALERTHIALRLAALSERRDAIIATTVVALILRGSRVTCMWAGDSRAYRFRGRRLKLLTRDHSLVQEMVSAGTLTAEEAEHHPQRHIITRAVGADCHGLALERLSDDVEPGDLYLLCSDGVSVALSEAEITAVLEQPSSLAANELIAIALEHKAQDNVTAVVVSVPTDET